MKKAVVAKIKDSNGHILLLERYSHDRTNAGWCLPGGKVDEGESFQDAITREVWEETGLRVLQWDYVNMYLSKLEGREDFEVYVYDLVTVGNIALNKEELKSYGWFNIEHLPTLAGNTKTAIEL